MAFEITLNALNASRNTELLPNIVFKIEGVNTLFGAVQIVEQLKYGSGLTYGTPGLIYGGSIPISNQKSYISFSAGTSSQIKQTLKQDKGQGDSVSSLRIVLIDKNKEISNLISPGNVVTDVLGRRCKVYFGFANTNWPEDYIVIFRGIIEEVDSGSGKVSFDLSHPDQKKRQELFIPYEDELQSNITSGSTLIDVNDSNSLLLPIVGPDGITVDPDFKTYIRIDDELMEVSSKTTTQLTVTRGELNTAAVSHSSGAVISSVYRLGPSSQIDLALKLMLSGINDYAFEDIEITNFVRISVSETVNNSIFFKNVDVTREYNIQVGDYIETTGATNSGNNVSQAKINGVVIVDNGSYITIDGVSFVEEINTDALLKIRSQYDVWPEGLGMRPDEVDINEHLDIKNSFLPDFEMDFRLDEEINGKDFLAEQLYNPASMFSLPRKAQSSCGIHTPPLPTENIKIIDINNVVNPGDLSIRRSMNRNRTTTVVYKFDQNILDPDRFDRGTIGINNTAIDQVGGVQKTLQIESKGMREALSATQLANTASDRRLKKYAFGAEYIKNIQLHFRDGFNLEVGDKVLVDIASLQITDVETGTRSGESRIFEVDNRSIDLRTGNVRVDVVDTNFDKDARFGLISPSSLIREGIDEKTFVIKESFASRFGINEFLKWQDFPNATVTVRSSDFSDIGTANIASIVGNTITLDADLGFIPGVDYIMEYSKYNDQETNNVLSIYVHLSDDDNDFADGGKPYGLA